LKHVKTVFQQGPEKNIGNLDVAKNFSNEAG